jgi:hypothetical protein
MYIYKLRYKAMAITTSKTINYRVQERQLVHQLWKTCVALNMEGLISDKILPSHHHTDVCGCKYDLPSDMSSQPLKNTAGQITEMVNEQGPLAHLRSGVCSYSNFPRGHPDH